MSLLQRTAEALYLTWTANDDDPASYYGLPVDTRLGWERLALTALTIAYREPVTEDVHLVP